MRGAAAGESRWEDVEVVSATGDRDENNAEILLRIDVTGTYDNGIGGPADVVGTRCVLLVQGGRYELFTPVPHRC